MDDHFIVRLYYRFEPRVGWLPYVLLFATVGLIAAAVTGVGFVPEDSVVGYAVLLGFVLSGILAQRRVRWPVAWAILILAGLVLTVVILAHLWPPLSAIGEGGKALMGYWRENLALFADRIGGWGKAVFGGGSSRETLPFAWGLGLAGWFVASYVAWSAFAQHRPYWGLTLAGLALALATYFGQAPLYWTVFFVGLAITAATVLNYNDQEANWNQRGVDYSPETRLDLVVYGGAISLLLMSLAMALPSFNARAIAEAFRRQETVTQTEQTLERAFAGVEQPRKNLSSGRGAGSGMLPRGFLLGAAPELQNTLVMTATYAAEVDGRRLTLPELEALTSGLHWRALSYDIYTGYGWARSPEREELFSTGSSIPLPAAELAPATLPVTLTQTIDWVYDVRTTRYTLGHPLAFDHQVKTEWRGLNDLVRVGGESAVVSSYRAQSRVIPATADQLRTAKLEDVPPEIMARYTGLPGTVTPRVRELARVIATRGAAVEGQAPTPYDQARAIETFLRQYPYSLDIDAPPEGVDMVDYFLFDLQKGFCDYYASAMVVMARSVGLPARLAIGYLQQPPDPLGVQRIRQVNAHSWAEIYFAGYGWVEFEPTAPFDARAEATPVPAGQPTPYAPYAPMAAQPPAIPDRDPQGGPLWPYAVLAVGCLLSVWWLWGRHVLARRRNPGPPLDDIQSAFAHLQDAAAALGRPPRVGQTPAEFAAQLDDHLRGRAASDPVAAGLLPQVDRLAHLFVTRQYRGESRPGNLAQSEARDLWRRLRWPLWRLRFRNRVSEGPRRD